MSSSNITNSTSSGRDCETEAFSPGELVGGVACALAAGLFVALSMVLQRFALTYPPGAKVPFLCCKFSRPFVWTTGMITYQLSQAVYQLSMVLAPLSLCTTAFTLLLVWNVILSRRLLGERPSRSRVVGAIVIVVGAVISVFGVPADVCNRFTLIDIRILFFERPPGGIFAAVEFGIMLVFAALVWWFDNKYAIRNPPAPLELESKKKAPKKPPRIKPPPPVWMDDIMVLLAPVALAIQEGFGAIIAKALASIIWNDAAHPGGGPRVNYPLWYILWAMVVALSSLSIVFLKLVYARYEATTALPIEYGTVHFCQIMAGVLFYEEYKAMSPTQYALCFLGLAVVLSGVGLSSELHTRHKQQANKAVQHSPRKDQVQPYAGKPSTSGHANGHTNGHATLEGAPASPLASPPDSHDGRGKNKTQTVEIGVGADTGYEA